MPVFQARPLSSAAVEVLGQLFVNGPTWDGNLTSKAGCSELASMGLVRRVDGWSFLTGYGVRTAIEWDRAALRSWHDKRWHDKASQR